MSGLELRTIEGIDAVFLAVCLIGISVALVLIGVASDTIARHLVQIVPLIVLVVLVLVRRALAPYLVVGLCAFWAVIMVLIWLYLLDLSGVAAGTYSLGEILLTVVIAVFSVLGILRGTRAAKQVPSPTIAALIAIGFVIQAVVMSVSIRFLN